MGGAVIPLQIASSALTVLGQVQAGARANAAAKADARQQEVLANRERAAGQRRGIAARREAQIARSNALARLAARGGGADADADDLLARLEGQGELNALTALGDGEARAGDREFAAARSRFDGKGRKQAAHLGALSDGLSYAAKYGKLLEQK